MRFREFLGALSCTLPLITYTLHPHSIKPYSNQVVTNVDNQLW